MRLINSLTILIMILFISFSVNAQEKKELKGKEIFQSAKCKMCHSIETEKLTTKGKGGDLSAVGSQKKADWIAKYLKKTEKLNDKVHPITYSGNDEELKTLTDWLATLKKGSK